MDEWMDGWMDGWNGVEKGREGREEMWIDG